MTVAERMLSEFDDEFAMTRRLLSLVPDDRMAWRPHPKSMELGRLAWHLAEFPEWCIGTIEQNPLRMTMADAEKSTHGWEGKTHLQILALFDTRLPAARAAILALSDVKLAERWKLEWAGQIVIDEPRQDAIDKWTFRHMVHHRAQLGVYLRMLGIAIPGAYGPSADEMEVVPTAA